MTHPQERLRPVVDDLQTRLDCLRLTYHVLEKDFGRHCEAISRPGQATALDATCVAELARVIKAAARATESAALLLDDDEVIAAAAMASSAADYLYTLARTAAEQAATPRPAQQPERVYARSAPERAVHV